MVSTIRQTVVIPRQSAAQLFDAYLSARGHTAITGGATARINKKVGASFTAWDGYIEGTNLAIVPKRLVVQSWRTSEFTARDPDSILVLAFSDSPKGGCIDMVHTSVPDAGAASYEQGWKDSYWTPWKAYAKRLAK